MELKSVKIEKPSDMNMILGQSHFIKTVEDLHEAIVNSVAAGRFAVAFCEASGPCLIRFSGNDESLIDLAKRNAKAISAGHSFVIFMEGIYPINVLNAIKDVPEVCSIFCATANDVEVILAESDGGRGIIGVIDGKSPKGIESSKDAEERKSFLRKIGYKA